VAGKTSVFNFTKANRILKKLEFKSVLDHGSKVVAPHVVVYGIGGSAAPRLGLIVSKKVGNAVTRNRVKRMIREIFRHRLPELTQDQGVDIVVIARYSAGNVPFEELALALNGSITRLKRRLTPGSQNG
jgi:ribonuclease P protein component